jgi:hypothetical protein
MRNAVILLLAGILRAQDGQSGSRPGWPCVPGRAVDPAYIETSESTGGQLFLFQKREVAQSGPVLSASYTHPATVLRAIGTLNGTRDYEFPVDSTVESLMVLVSLQCRNSIVVTRPNGAPLTEANSALSVDLQAGRILRVDNPEAGMWRIRMTGTGLFVVSALAKSGLRLRSVAFPAGGKVSVRVAGEASEVAMRVVDAEGNAITEKVAMERDEDGSYRGEFPAVGRRYRVVVTGMDAGATPFQRTYPNLFR